MTGTSTSPSTPSRGVEVRQASPDRGPGHLLRQEFLAASAAFLGQPLDSPEMLAADPDLTPPNGVFFVVSVDGVDVGCGGARRLPEAPEPTVEVKRMYVKGIARGRGAGRALLQEIEGWARSLGATSLVLDTSDRLPEAPNLYRSAGFSPIAAYNSNPHADLWMAKPLTEEEASS